VNPGPGGTTTTPAANNTTPGEPESTGEPGGEETLEEEMERLSARNMEIHAILTPTFAVTNEIVNPPGEFDSPVSYFLGVDDIPFTEGVASEPMVGGGFSVVLIRLEDSADIEAEMKRIRENVDPMKWVCDGVDPDDVIVDNIGSLVVVIMSNDSKGMQEAFKGLEGNTEGDLSDLIDDMYEIYFADVDLEALNQESEQINERLEEIGNILWPAE
jgi:hypothetical protein